MYAPGRPYFLKEQSHKTMFIQWKFLTWHLNQLWGK
jgi:hypothetical protein